MLTIISMHNVIQLLEASTPLQRNVSVKKLLPCFNITGGINLKPVLIKESDHFCVGGSLLAGIVVGSAATTHSPSLYERNRSNMLEKRRSWDRKEQLDHKIYV